MRRLLIVVLLIALSALQAAASSLSYGLEYRSRYIWRGLDFYRNNRAAVQGYVKYSFAEGFGVKLFGSFATEDRGALKDLEEIDLILSYSRKVGDVVLSLGFSNYGFYFRDKFDFDRDNSQEFNAGVSFTSLPLSPAVTLYWHAGFKRWFYIELSVGQKIYEAGKVRLDLSGDLGYDGKQNVSEAGFTNAGVTLRCSVKVSGKFKISPYIRYVRIFKREVNPSENEMVLGLKFDI